MNLQIERNEVSGMAMSVQSAVPLAEGTLR